MINETRFSAEQCHKLFAAVLVHDAIHLTATLPDKIHLNYNQDQLSLCYQICRQLWQDGVDRKVLSAITKNLYTQHSLNLDDQHSFKYIRAKFKHLRFAYITFNHVHCQPTFFNHLTIIMGRLQDVIKNQHVTSMSGYALYLRFLLTKFIYAFSTREIKQFNPSTPKAFRKYIYNEIHFIRLNLIKKEITSKEFHLMRKIISRQVALYDNLKTLYPSTYHNEISSYLSTINGLMGNMHDTLITAKLEKTQNYYSDTFEIPDKIKQRLISLTEKYEIPL